MHPEDARYPQRDGAYYRATAERTLAIAKTRVPQDEELRNRLRPPSPADRPLQKTVCTKRMVDGDSTP
jgi:hypothetical protein